MTSRSADLRRRVLFVGAPLAALTVAIAAFITSRVATQQFEGLTMRAIATAARRAAETVDLYLREEESALAFLATTPTVIDHARASGERARLLGLDRLPTATLETRYASTRILEPDQGMNAFLSRLRTESDVAELFLTDRHGLVVAASDPTSDFVQSDEAWWQRAVAAGSDQDAPQFDESAGVAAVGLAARVDDPETGEFVGVLKGALDLSRLSRILAAPGDTTVIPVQVVDSAGRVVATAERRLLLRPLADAPQVPLRPQAAVATLRSPGAPPQLVASIPANRGRWWVVAREPSSSSAIAVAVRRVVLLAAAALLALMLIVMWWLSSWLNRRVTHPVRIAGDIAGRVASGDLSVSVTEHEGGTEEVRLLLSSVESMVAALRTLVGQIRSASEESAAMAEEISASTQQMSASTQEMANTCQGLTAQATQEAETVRAAADDAKRILGIATTLAEGAREAATRTTALTDQASQHRERLVTGSGQLARLANDLERAATDAQALSSMSEEIQSFVKQAREIGAQTNMLALNAAIEASRADGGESRGFAVVADEVRTLATQASRAATATSETVRNVLTTIQATRDRMSHLVESSTAVREIAESAAQGLVEIAKAARETSAWTDDISGAASEVRHLVEEITQRLATIAEGTEGVVAAAEEIAASAQEQSASTQEIASSAAQLAESAERLTAAVSTFRVPTDARPRVRPSD